MVSRLREKLRPRWDQNLPSGTEGAGVGLRSKFVFSEDQKVEEPEAASSSSLDQNGLVGGACGRGSVRFLLSGSSVET